MTETLTDASGQTFVFGWNGDLCDVATSVWQHVYRHDTSVAPRERARDGGNPYQGRRRADSLVINATGQSSAA